MGIKQVLSAPRSPWQRAYVERVIGTIRRECLDHVIAFGERSLAFVNLNFQPVLTASVLRYLFRTPWQFTRRARLIS
jgi:transposase InsO family protein